MSLRDDINIPVIVVLGVTTGLIVAVAIIGTQAGYNYVTQVDLARKYDYAEQRGFLHYGQNIFDGQTKALNAEEPAYVAVDKSAVRMPLTRAEALMIQSKGKARSAAPAATQPAK